MVKLSLSKTLSYMTKLILIWFLKMVVSYTGLMVFLVLSGNTPGLRSYYYLLVRQVGLYRHGLLVVVLLLVASLQPQEVAVEGIKRMANRR